MAKFESKHYDWINRLKVFLDNDERVEEFKSVLLNGIGGELILIDDKANDVAHYLQCYISPKNFFWAGKIYFDDFSCYEDGLDNPVLHKQIQRNYRKFMAQWNGYKDDCISFMIDEKNHELINDIDSTFENA